MPAAVLNLSIEQGTTFTRLLTFKDELDNELDLTGQTFAGSIRYNIGDADPVAQFDFEVLDQVTNTGEVMMTLTAEASEAIPIVPQRKLPRKIVPLAYDVERTFPDNTVQRVLQGIVNLSPEVTKE